MSKNPFLWVLGAVFTASLAMTVGCVRAYQVEAQPAFMNTPTVTPTPTAIPLIKQVNDDNFAEEVLNSDIPVLVDFYADWCGHCMDFLSALEQFAQEYSGRIKVVCVDYDTNFSLPAAYHISSLPTFIFIKDGEELTRLLWPQNLASLEAAADAILVSDP